MKVIYINNTLHVGRLPWELVEGEAPMEPLTGEPLREALVATVRHLAFERLRHTDWYVTRNAETGEAIPSAVQDERSAIRAWSNDRETLINAAADDAEMLAVDLTRPE